MTEITEKFMRRGRWHVRTKNSLGRRTMPYANYVWLKGNPSFSYIPNGYVVHHLDYDPLNDDISNLAIMYKHHHVAHHFKYKNIETKVVIDPDLGMPEKPLRMYYKSDRDAYMVRYIIYVGASKKEKLLYKLDGKPFKTKSEAINACLYLWPHLEECDIILPPSDRPM